MLKKYRYFERTYVVFKIFQKIISEKKKINIYSCREKCAQLKYMEYNLKIKG